MSNNPSEKHRQQIGNLLHDTVSQQLTAMRMLLEKLKCRSEKLEAKDLETVEQLEGLAVTAMDQLSRIMEGLNPVPMDDQGLPGALEQMGAQTIRTYNVGCSVDVADNVEIQDDFTAGQLFLIAREAVHNAIKHAQPKAIEVCLSQQASRIVLTVRDDGCGTSADIKSSKGAGLHIMQHRALTIGGLLDIRSTPGQGTEVRCELT